MLAHSVYFWLKEDLTAEQRNAFRKGLESLQGIPCAEVVYIGTPAPTTKRPVIDDTYSFGLIVVCPDIAGHDTYQTHPLHQAFVKEFSSFWNRVAIYDFA